MSAISRDNRPYQPLLQRGIELSRINLEVVAFVGLVLLSIVAHLWNLDRMAMHHDESVTSWLAWKFYTGTGSFNCAFGRSAASYCYDPVYHGPAYYILMLLSFFLFGDGEAQARLPIAAAGVAMVASTWMLRPYLGPRGTFAAATLLAFSPSLLYYTRFSRHDGLILLWTLWMVIGFFRFLDSGKSRWLYLLAVATALAIATHELYYILLFLFGSFVLIRLASETLARRTVALVLGVLSLVTLVVGFWNPEIGSFHAGGISFLFLSVFAVGALMHLRWDAAPLLSRRLRALDRQTILVALGLLFGVYALLYTVFFTDMPGIAGAYQGLAYWLGSQHEYARGRQPWYYYLMLLPIYEPLALFAAVGAAITLLLGGLPAQICGLRRSAQTGAVANDTAADTVPVAAEPTDAAATDGYSDIVVVDLARDADDGPGPRVYDVPEDAVPQAIDSRALLVALVPLFLVFWFVGSLVAFSWAGEKMPWLLTHIALPGNLLAGWVIGRLFDGVRWREVPASAAWLVPPALLLLLIALGVAMWRFSQSGAEQAAQASLLQGFIPLAIVGVLIYALLTIGGRVGRRATLSLVALTLVGVVGAYMIRSTWMVVYDHPDTPIEVMVYTQSSPDVPEIVRDLELLAINQTRNNRNVNDPTGGNSMPIIMDNGGSGGDYSLGWPFNWYFRNFKRMELRNADTFANPTADTFMVAKDSSQPDSEKIMAPVIMISVPHITDATRTALNENYVRRYQSKLNWWFPEGDTSGCDPRSVGYKQFFYSTATRDEAAADPACERLDVQNLPYAAPWAPIVWPLQRDHWDEIGRYLLFRKLADDQRLDGREFEVWVRKDLVGGGGDVSGATSAGTIKLLAQRVIANGQLSDPRGMTVDAQGNVYIANTAANTIDVFGPNGDMVRSFGSLGSGDGQFNEPRGVALDAQGNIYVADTWNARVVKLSPEGQFIKAWGEGNQDFGNGQRATMTDRTQAGNEAAGLGLFGPRSVAIDGDGNVYIADTGNRRIVVTDTEGQLKYQWGYEGDAPGLFEEPGGVALDAQGNLYVADIWNGRVQVFAPGQDGTMLPDPIAVWNVAGWLPNSYDDPSIAASPDGHVLVSVPSRNQIIYAEQNGTTLLQWGGVGTDAASVNMPSGMAFGGNNNVYVVDRGNNRILQYMLPDQSVLQSAGQS